jgi:hypothetical protein
MSRVGRFCSQDVETWVRWGWCRVGERSRLRSSCCFFPFCFQVWLSGLGGLTYKLQEMKSRQVPPFTHPNHIHFACSWHQIKADFLLSLFQLILVDSDAKLVRSLELKVNKSFPFDLEGYRQL